MEQTIGDISVILMDSSFLVVNLYFIAARVYLPTFQLWVSLYSLLGLDSMLNILYEVEFSGLNIIYVVAFRNYVQFK